MSNSPATEEDLELVMRAARSLEDARARLKKIADDRKSNQHGVEMTLLAAQQALKAAKDEVTAALESFRDAHPSTRG